MFRLFRKIPGSREEARVNQECQARRGMAQVARFAALHSDKLVHEMGECVHLLDGYMREEIVGQAVEEPILHQGGAE